MTRIVFLLGKTDHHVEQEKVIVKKKEKILSNITKRLKKKVINSVTLSKATSMIPTVTSPIKTCLVSSGFLISVSKQSL